MKSLIKLNPEQLAYLKSLDSKKKKRKFLLDCLVECIEVGIEVEELIAKSNEPQPPMEFCVEVTDENKSVLDKLWNQFWKTFEVGLCKGYLHSNSLCAFLDLSLSSRDFPIVTTDEFLKYIGREDLIERKSVKISELPSKQFEFEKVEFNTKNYNPEEIELSKHNIEQREVSEQGSELLKFDMLKDDKDIFMEIYNLGKKDEKEINKTAPNYKKRRENYLLDKFVAKYCNENAN